MGARAWRELVVERGVAIDGFACDVFRWDDARGRPRTAAMVRNDARDPAGFFGGYLRRFTYERSDGSILVATGGRSPQHPGWGYTLHHQEGLPDRDTLSSRRAPGSFRCVFAGRHHALYEYAWTVLRTQGDVARGVDPVDWPIAVTTRWLFATASDGPVWAHAVDLGALAPDAIEADDRSPAGELCFDGSFAGVVSGAGWGDRYRFVTTSAPLSTASSWDYAQPNRVPYVRLWSDEANAEIGAVQTWDVDHRDAGYGWLFHQWGRTSETRADGPGMPARGARERMPVDWNWTYQLNQYELGAPGEATTSKRLNWGTNFGAVGRATYPAYGGARSASGYPVAARSTRLVLGPKGATLDEVERTSAALDVSLTALAGTVTARGARGFSGSSSIDTFAPAGWNHVYGAFELVAAAGGARVRIVTGPHGLERAVFRLRSWRGPERPAVTLDGAALIADVDFLASLVTHDGEPELWLTIVRAVRGASELVVA